MFYVVLESKGAEGIDRSVQVARLDRQQAQDICDTVNRVAPEDYYYAVYTEITVLALIAEEDLLIGLTA